MDAVAAPIGGRSAGGRRPMDEQSMNAVDDAPLIVILSAEPALSVVCRQEIDR
jgi:hypothetical protein